MSQAKLKISVNKNPTKQGIKVQFILPEGVGGDQKSEMTQKLQQKLNTGLAQFNMTANIDTDVPYQNIIGFLIRIEDIKLLIKKALSPESKMEPNEKTQNTNIQSNKPQQQPRL